jgi:hypothetical protein
LHWGIHFVAHFVSLLNKTKGIGIGLEPWPTKLWKIILWKMKLTTYISKKTSGFLTNIELLDFLRLSGFKVIYSLISGDFVSELPMVVDGVCNFVAVSKQFTIHWLVNGTIIRTLCLFDFS